MNTDEQTPQPTVTLTAHAVSLLPENHVDFPLFVIYVEREHRTDLWKIRAGSHVLDSNGLWQLNGPCRCGGSHAPRLFALDDALRRATEAAPDVRFGDRTAIDVYRQSQEPK